MIVREKSLPLFLRLSAPLSAMGENLREDSAHGRTDAKGEGSDKKRNRKFKQRVGRVVFVFLGVIF